MPLLLINLERVLAEVLEMSRYKIANLLSIDREKIVIKIDIEDGVFKPTFSVDFPDMAKNFEKSYIQRVMMQVWLEKGKPELKERLKGLSERRYGFQKKEDTEKGTDKKKGKTRSTRKK